MTIRAITFDFWGTLFQDTGSTPRKAVRQEALARIARVSPQAAGEALEASYEDFLRMHLEEQRTRTPEEAVDYVCKRLGVTLFPSEFSTLAAVFAEAILDHPPSPIRGALEAVRAASERVPVGIISDTGISPAASLRVLLDREGFTPYLSALSFSDEVGMAKPQAPMFERTAAALGVAPSELLHIGDLEPTDIAGVRALGGLGALFIAVNRKFESVTQAEYVFESWQEFIDWLPEILP
jgi:putative hydrolase of the HAD superfamily